MNDDLIINTGGLDVDISQYVGIWAVEPMRFMAMLERIGSLDLAAHVAERQAQADMGPTTLSQGVAIVPILGTMTKYGSSFSPNGSTIVARQRIRKAIQAEDVGALMLLIDSPGGTVSGTQDLAEEIAKANSTKPVWAFIEDFGASAAYWAASQASKVFINSPTAMAGSIGTYAGLYDLSGKAAREGVKAVVIRSGKFKGAGFPGTEISDEQKAEWQAIIDKTQAQFTAGVARGRKMSLPVVEALADGRMHIAADAHSLGLIDGIQSFDETMRQLLAVANSSVSKSKRRSAMSEPVTTAAAEQPKPATFHELKAACTGADSEFLCAQLGANATVEQAQKAWMTEMSRRLEAANKAAADAKAEAAKAAEQAKAQASKPGVPPLGAGSKPSSSDISDPVSAWNEAVETKVKAGMKKDRAITTVAREQPELHRAYIEAANARRSA